MRRQLGLVLAVALLGGCGQKDGDGTRKRAATPGTPALAPAIAGDGSGEPSGVKRPDWLIDEKPGTGACRARDGGLDCSGSSKLLPDRAAAEGDAVARAVDAMVSELVKATGATPDAIRAELATALGSPPKPDDHWWQEYEAESGQGTEFSVFARVILSADKHGAITTKLGAAK